jgi:CDP-diacylglycerol--glycerol-3-phosphate 3-phosphatidyltransferase
VVILALLAFYLFQLAAALIKYKKISTFHTYIAKVAALLQGCFLIPIFFIKQPVLWLFYPAVIVTLIDIIEETILVFMLPQNRSDVKGLYWVLKERN